MSNFVEPLDISFEQFSEAGNAARDVIADLLIERARQRRDWPNQQGRLDGPWLGILGEEFGEVCRATLGNEDAGDLRKELIQVAAVAVAWVEAIDANKEKRDD